MPTSLLLQPPVLLEPPVPLAPPLAEARPPVPPPGVLAVPSPVTVPAAAHSTSAHAASARPTSGRSASGRPTSGRSGAWRWVARVVVAVLLVGSLLLDAGALLVVPVLFVLVVPFEKLFPRHSGQRLRRPGVRTDLTYAVAGPALNIVSIVVAVVVGIVSLAWIPGLLLRPFVELVPAALLPFVGIVLFDVAIYWVHRLSHQIPLFWRFHAVHHSSRQMDWVSGFRNHPFDGAILAPPFVFLLAAGFDATFTGVLAAVQIVSGLFVHANVRWRLRPLHHVIITPEFHHWHHANEPDAHNSNFSVFLPLWDIVFGTYYMPRDRRPLLYGVDDAMPDDVFGQLLAPFAGIGGWRDRRRRRSISGVAHRNRDANEDGGGRLTG